MPKMKTRKAVAARFKVTATGQLKYSRAGRRHLLGPKRGKKKRQLRGKAILSSARLKMYKQAMGV